MVGRWKAEDGRISIKNATIKIVIFSFAVFPPLLLYNWLCFDSAISIYVPLIRGRITLMIIAIQRPHGIT